MYIVAVQLRGSGALGPTPNYNGFNRCGKLFIGSLLFSGPGTRCDAARARRYNAKH